MLLAQKIELRPDEKQIAYLEQSFGCRRHAFNNLLAHFSKPENKWSKKVAVKHFMDVMRVEFGFYSEISSRITRNTIDDLDNAFSHFFRRVKAKQNPGFPRFKKKGFGEKFSIREKEKFDIEGRELRIEKLKTKIKLRQKLRFSGTAKQITVTKKAGKYFVSVLVDTQDYNPKDVDRQKSVGVDFGLKNLAVLSNGESFEANQKLKASLKKLAKLQKNMARKQKDSNRRAKAKLKIGKLHYRITNQRQAVLHGLSDYLTKSFDVITIEDLNVKGMIRNRKLARAISDAGFGYLRQQLEYKSKLRNNTLVIANRWYPSSKTCFCCGEVKKELDLSERVFTCDCGYSNDRDLNAALNLEKYGLDSLKPDLKRTEELCKTDSVIVGIGVDTVNMDTISISDSCFHNHL